MNINEEQLRRIYIRGDLKFRLGVIEARIEYANCGPNLLCNYVMAIESLTRTIVLEEDLISVRADEERAWEIYNTKYRRQNHINLIIRLCENAETTPSKAFGEETWNDLQESNEWRNFLIHEGGFIDGGNSDRIVASCIKVLNLLKEVVEVRYQGNITIQSGANALLENWRVQESHKVLRNEPYDKYIWDRQAEEWLAENRIKEKEDKKTNQ